MRYAENTIVSSERSRAEIEHVLSRYGATGFMYGWQKDAAVIMFDMLNRRVRFVLKMPDKNGHEIACTPTGRKRKPNQVQEAYEQATRQHWRALALVIKAKLEAVESSISEFEEEFLAHIVLPNNTTVGQFMRPQIELAYGSGKMPPMLPAPDRSKK
jgi:hypothetical protein